MNDSRWEQLAPLTGAVFFVLAVAGVVVISNYSYLPSTTEILEFLENGSTRIRLGGYLGALSVAFLLWFLGSLRSTLRAAEGGTGRLSAVAFAGGIVAGAGLLVANAALIVAAVRADAEGGIGADAAVALFDLSGSLGGLVVPIGLAVAVGAAAVVAFRTGVFPAWFAWVSGLIALATVSPIGWAAQGAALLWILVVSVWLYVRGRTPPEVTQPAA